ncbi:hypothetical protein V2G26_015403 [Clonostachys chloroleuca]
MPHIIRRCQRCIRHDAGRHLERNVSIVHQSGLDLLFRPHSRACNHRHHLAEFLRLGLKLHCAAAKSSFPLPVCLIAISK